MQCKSDGDQDRIVRVLKALADPRRYDMIRRIGRSGELSCSQVGEHFALSQPAISHHLKILHDAGVLQVRTKGQRHFISVNRALVRDVLRSVMSESAINRTGRATFSADRSRSAKNAGNGVKNTGRRSQREKR